ncbi:MAG: radical SAM protein [Candidatus Aenigmarchaeota archaeon]|nr:radical SAM protein [Candidatus Aenigmarchaeota archaeon]
MKEKIERIANWMKGRKVGPYTIELNITNKCNLKCRMCWLRNFSCSRKEIENSKWIKIVEEACQLGVKEFRIPGSGEPFVKKKLVLEMVKIIKKNKRKGLIITNGTLIDDEVTEVLVKFGWDIVTISIDGPVPEIHNFIRNSDHAFQKTIDGVRKINGYKRLYGKKLPYLRMNTVITSVNVNKLEEMIELGYRLGFSEVLFQPITVFSEEGRKLLPKKKDVRDNLKKVMKKAESLGIYTNAKNLLKKGSIKAEDLPKLWKKVIETNDGFLKIPCYEPFYNIVITPYGEVGPCAVFGGNSSLNVCSTNLKNIWYEGFEEFRKRLRKGEMFDFCKNCCVPIFLENERIREVLRREIYGR